MFLIKRHLLILNPMSQDLIILTMQITVGRKKKQYAQNQQAENKGVTNVSEER